MILLDVMMPDMDGLEVVRRLKADRNLPFIPVIMQTALDSTERMVAGLEAGADDTSRSRSISRSWRHGYAPSSGSRSFSSVE